MIKLSNKNKNYPRHIAIILDGNRRWAKKRGLPSWKGHKAGYEKVNKLLDWIKELEIKELTLYLFSTQNFKRSRLEIRFLMTLFQNAFIKALKDLRIDKYQTKIRFCGELNILPKKIQKVIKELQRKTAKYKQRLINLCIVYGGREEIVDAINRIWARIKNKELKIKNFTKELIEENLDIKSSPDIIIRTSGEHRTSGFLCWQQAYSEWFFVKKFWPDFTKADLVRIIYEYQNRERRFGK